MKNILVALHILTLPLLLLISLPITIPVSIIYAIKGKKVTLFELEFK